MVYELIFLSTPAIGVHSKFTKLLGNHENMYVSRPHRQGGLRGSLLAFKDPFFYTA